MSRDSNGNYTLPAGNPVVSGEVISTSWANPTMSDIAAEITNSLDRNGRGGMLAPFKNVDGTASNPGMTWGNEPTTGFYRNAAQDMRAVVGGFPRMRWDANGVQLWNGTVWSDVISAVTLDPILATKGYAVKSANESITGAWSFTQSVGAPSLYHASQIDLLTNSVTRLRVTDAGASITGTLGVSGAATLASLGVTGAATVGSTLNVTGAATFNNTLSVLGQITADVGAIFGGSASSGEKALKFRNVNFTLGIDVVLSAAGDAFGFYRRDTGGWFYNYTPATGLSTFTGTVNATAGLQVNGVAVVPVTRGITGTNSIAGGGDLTQSRNMALVNDVATPGSSWYYGTDAAGTKGWFPLSGVVGVPEAPVDGTAYARQNASWVSIGSGGVYVLKTGDTMSGALGVVTASPSFILYDTAGSVDSKRSVLIQQNDAFSVRFTDDPWNTHTDALRITRNGSRYPINVNFAAERIALAPEIGGDRVVIDASAAIAGTGVVVRATNTADTAFTPLRLQGSQVDFYGNSTSQPVAQANAAGLEVLYGKYFTCFNSDNSKGLQIVAIGTTGYIAGSVGDIAIQVGGSNAMTFSGAYAAVLGDRTFRLYNPGNTDYTYFKFNSANNLDLIGPSSATRFDYYLSGGSDWIASFNKESLTIKQNTSGFAALRLQKNDLNVGATEGTSLEFYEGGGISGWIRCLRNGSGTMQIHNTQVGALDLNTNGAIIFTIAGSIYADMSSGSFNMYDGKPIRLYNAGNVKNSELAYVSDSGGNANIRMCGRGAAWHWTDTALTGGWISVSTTTPAATGPAGAIVLVYE